jgi:hypothetical protein
MRGSGDGHVIATIPILGAALAPCMGNDLASGLAIRIWDRALWVTVFCLVLGTSPVLDIVVVTLLALHDVTTLGALYSRSYSANAAAPGPHTKDGAGRCSCERHAHVSHAVRPRLVGVVLVDLHTNGGEFAMRKSIRLTTRMPA